MIIRHRCTQECRGGVSTSCSPKTVLKSIVKISNKTQLHNHKPPILTIWQKTCRAPFPPAGASTSTETVFCHVSLSIKHFDRRFLHRYICSLNLQRRVIWQMGKGVLTYSANIRSCFRRSQDLNPAPLKRCFHVDVVHLFVCVKIIGLNKKTS